ncbi:MAG: glycosyltransferase family 9 protein [Candidatus Methylacidiphilales bacterium]
MRRAVLVSRCDRVGDVIITTACLPALRAAHPGAPIWMIARPVMASLFSHNRVVDGFIALPENGQIEDLEDRMRDLNASAIYHFHPDGMVQKAAAHAGIPHRFGFSGPGEEHLTGVLPYRKSEGLRHEAEYTLELVETFSTVTSQSLQPLAYAVDPDLRAQESLHEKAPWLDASLECVLLNPTTARADLRWPAEYFSKVGSELAQAGWRLVLIGHPGRDEGLEAVRKGWKREGTPFEDLGGTLDLAELAWLMSRARLHVSRDTGTSHLAAAMGCPQIAVMGRPEGEFSPVRWRPLGSGVEVVATQARRRFYETRRMFWSRSFRSIHPERVIEVANRLLLRNHPIE